MVSLKDIESAHERIQPFIHRTPVLTNTSLNDETGANLFLNAKISKRQDLSKFVAQPMP